MNKKYCLNEIKRAIDLVKLYITFSIFFFINLWLNYKVYTAMLTMHKLDCLRIVLVDIVHAKSIKKDSESSSLFTFPLLFLEYETTIPKLLIEQVSLNQLDLNIFNH